MDQNTHDPLDVVDGFLAPERDIVPLKGKWLFEITRADGSVERHEICNTMQYLGLNKVAQMLTSNAQSAFLYLAVGTVTAQASLGSTDFGEVSRKIAATQTSSNEVAILVATWAGNADSLTGVALASGASVNHASSGQGQILNIVNSVDTTLQASDFLKVQMEVQVGSHNLP